MSTNTDPVPLMDQCFWYVHSHVYQFPEEHILYLPSTVRTKLLLCLPVSDVWRLERTRLIEGLDMNEVWKILCDDRLGALLVSSPELSLCYTYRASCRDVYLAYLWKALCDIDNCEGSRAEAVERALFHVPYLCLVKHALGSSARTHVSEKLHGGHFSDSYDASAYASCIADRGLSYITRIINTMAGMCHVRPCMFQVDNWNLIDSQMRCNHDSFAILLSELEALAMRFSCENAFNILQHLMCDTSYSTEQRARILPFFMEKIESQNMCGQRCTDLIKILFLSKKKNLTLYTEGPLIFSIIDVTRMTELSLILDDFELLDTQLKQLAISIAEICSHDVIQTFQVSVNLRRQHAIEWCASPHYVFMESSLLSLTQQKQLKALLLSGLISDTFSRSLILTFVSASCHCNQVLSIRKSIQVRGPPSENNFRSNFEDEFWKLKHIELHHCGSELLTWLFSLSDLHLGHLKIQDGVEKITSFTAAHFHIGTFILLLTSINSDLSKGQMRTFGQLFSSIFRSPVLQSFTIAMKPSVPNETCWAIIETFATHLLANAKSTSLQLLSLLLQCNEVNDTALRNTFEALLSLPHLESMNVTFHCQCAEARHIETLKESFRTRSKQFLFHFCSLSGAFSTHTCI